MQHTIALRRLAVAVVVNRLHNDSRGKNVLTIPPVRGVEGGRVRSAADVLQLEEVVLKRSGDRRALLARDFRPQDGRVSSVVVIRIVRMDLHVH